MNILFTVVIVIQVLSALAIIGLVLIQHGKGADMGASFGSGASGSLFGASGSSNFLSRSTAVSAAIFFCATLALAYFGNKRGAPAGVMDNLPAASAPAASAPSKPASAPAASAPQAPAAGAPAANAPAANAPASAPANPSNQIPK
jgi:preprotein translocase subunit SecG